MNISYLCGIKSVPTEIFQIFFFGSVIARWLMCFECNVAISSIQSAVSSLKHVYVILS